MESVNSDVGRSSKMVSRSYYVTLFVILFNWQNVVVKTLSTLIKIYWEAVLFENDLKDWSRDFFGACFRDSWCYFCLDTGENCIS